MNTENNDKPALPALPLTKGEETEVMRLAAVGFMPHEIAVSMEWPRERRAAFCVLASIPGSEISVLITAGRATGRAKPQIKLQEAATAGNIEAIKALQNLQRTNRFNELVSNMDDDEFTP